MAETAQAVLDGADEIDMVVNITDVKNHRYEEVENEIRAVREACREQVLKVIVETCYLTEEEKIAVCEAVTKAGADYIKTSTGFGTAGAAIEDVRLFREHIGPEVKIKAAGGIRTREALEGFSCGGMRPGRGFLCGGTFQKIIKCRLWRRKKRRMKAEWLSSWEFAHGANSFEIKGRPWRRKRGGGNPLDFLLEIGLGPISQKYSAALQAAEKR